MAHRPAASILIVIATMILALPAIGQQNLNPKNDGAHVALGMALAKKGDLDGAIAEFRAAMRLNRKMRTPTSSLAGRSDARGMRTGRWPRNARRCA